MFISRDLVSKVVETAFVNAHCRAGVQHNLHSEGCAITAQRVRAVFTAA